MTLLEVKRISHAHCIIPGLSKAVKITARASNFNWGHLTKRKKSSASGASWQLEAYELADRSTKKPYMAYADMFFAASWRPVEAYLNLTDFYCL
jgi:hypothetical protein